MSSSYLGAALAIAALSIPVLWLPAPARSLIPSRRRRVDTGVLLLIGCGVFGLLSQSILVPLCVAGAVVLRPSVAAVVANQRRIRNVALSWPTALEVLSMAVGVGMSFEELLGFVIRCGPEATRPLFELAQATLASGGTRRDALLLLAHHGGDPVRSVVDVLIAAERDGASVALVLDRLAAESGRAHRLVAEERARRAPVLMLAPLTLCSLPAVLIGTIAPFILLTFGQTSF